MQEFSKFVTQTYKIIKRGGKTSARNFGTLFLVFTTIIWALGVPLALIVPQSALADVPTLVGGIPDGTTGIPIEALVDISSDIGLTSGTVNVSNVLMRQCTGVDQSTSTTACGPTGTPTVGAQLCTTVSYDTLLKKITCAHNSFTINNWYDFRVTTGVQASDSHPLAANVIRRMKTGSTFYSANLTPPTVMNTIPAGGAEFPANGNVVIMFPLGTEGSMKFSTPAVGDLNFCQGGACAVSIKKIENFQPTTEVCTDAVTCNFNWDSNLRKFTVDPVANLAVAAAGQPPVEYDLCVRGLPNALAVKNSANQTMPNDFCQRFKTLAADVIAPTLASTGATNPVNNATGVSPYSSDLVVRFAEKMNTSVLSLDTVRLCQDSTAGTAGCESGDTRLSDITKFSFLYNTMDNSAHIGPIAGDSLAASTKYCFEIVGGGSGVKDVSGNALTPTSSANCFTTGLATDPVTGGPTLSFADADSFKVVAHFNEAMRGTDLVNVGSPQTVNTANVALECPTGMAIALTAKEAQYRAEYKELEIRGLGLPQDQTCKITVTGARDLAGNVMTTAGSANIASFKVQNPTTTGGFLGGGGTGSTDFFGGMGGTAATFWEKPSRIQPRNVSTNKATSVEVEFPAPGAMPVSSTILLSFPSGFTLSTDAGNSRIVPSATSFMNADINGPETGTVTVTATTDTVGKTMTFTTVGAAIANGSMIRFELDRITTPTVAADSLRITAVIKDNTGVKIGQTINPGPFNIQEAGALSIAGKVCKGTTSGGSCGGSDTGIAGVKVFCTQMGGYMVGATSAAFMGFQSTTTAGDGTWSITGLTSGEYSCNIPPDPTTLVDLGGSPPFQPITLSTANKTGVDTKYKDMSALGAAVDVKVVTVNITGGPANEVVDVFCSAGASDFEFSAPVMKAITLTGTGGHPTPAPTLRLQQNKTYDCGMGPHMAFEQFGTGAPPPMPTFNFMPPKPQRVLVDADKTITFALASTNRTITGTVVDGSATGLANVYVNAQPVGCFDATSGAFKDCQGAFAQTKSDGTFTLNVSDGTYEVGANGPGLPPSTREIATANGANVTGVTLKMVKSSTTISGAIQDESGNGIKYAHVNAEKRTITSGSDACDFSNSRPSGGWADSPTDESGNYTLYAGAGTWCIRAFAPSYGEVGNKTVAVVSSSLSGQNIAATAANFGTVSGSVTKASSAISGAFINCYGSNGGNGASSGAAGTYSVKVKLASSGSTTMTCDGFAPGVGPLGRNTVTFASGDTTKTQNFTISGNPGTITVTATGLTDGFCDARDSTGGLGSGAPIEAGTATIKAPAGTYTIRCNSPKTGPLTLSTSTATLTAGSTATATVTVPTLRSVDGRITDGTSNLEGVTLKFTERSTSRSFEVKTGSQSGVNNNLSTSAIPEGTYNVTASKKGFEAANTTATVSGGNLTLATPVALTPTTTTAGETVTIPVQESSAAYAGEATVVATRTSGGSTKTVVGQIDSTTGNASMALANGTWTLTAVGDNGKATTSSSTIIIAGGSVSGSTPTLSLATSITGYTQKSESATLPLSSGGLLKFNDLAVGGVAPEINIPTNALSTTDSTTGKVEMKSDPTVAGIDPGADQNFVGASGYDITPKDANGKKLTDLSSAATITIPYTDADVSTAGVNESKLAVASYNTSSQTWESLPTVVDTTNNLLIATISHFSPFGVIGGVVTAAAVGSSSGDMTAPSAPTNITAVSDGSKVTLAWTDPTESDLYRVEVLRNAGGNTPVSGEVYAYVEKAVQKYVDTAVTVGTTYKYQLRVRDYSLNPKLTDLEYSVTVTAVTPGGGGGGGGASTPATPVTTTPATTTPTTTPVTTTPTTPATTTPTVTPSPTAAPVAVLIKDPTKLDQILSQLNLVSKPSEVAKYMPLIKSDAIAFKVKLSPEQETAITNFVSYGISEKTKDLGAGERRAVIRDYMETVGKADVNYEDIERISTGQKPVGRNLAKEQAKVSEVLKVFVKMVGHTPVFSDSKEDIAWNTMMYRIRFTRDLTQEQAGIVEYKAIFKKTPKTPLDWSAVRALGYALKD